MKHSDLQLLVSAFADGEISHTERTMVEQHLSVCRECRDFLGEIRIVHTHIRHEAHIQVSPFFAMHVLNRLREKEETQVRWSDVEAAARWTVVLLSGVAALWVAVLSFQNSSSITAIADSRLKVTGDSAASAVLLAGDESLKNDVSMSIMSK
jgi:predicted anti-sigma-YlaC factor YlaD